MTAKSLSRHLFLLLAALLLATLATVITWSLLPDPYQSSGAIEIKAYIKRMTATIDQSMLLPIYDKYVENQVALIRSPQCLTSAMDSPAFKTALARTNAAPSFNDFTHSLWITHDPTSDIINIRFVDNDAQTARAAVQSLIESYRTVAEQTDDSNRAQLDLLSQTIGLARQSIQTTQARIDALARDFGTEDLTLFVRTWASTLKGLDQAVQERESVLIRSPATADTDQEQLQKLRDVRDQNVSNLIAVQDLARPIAQLKQDLALAQDTLAKAEKIREPLALESLIGARISIVSDGTSPIQPYHRRNVLIVTASALVTFVSTITCLLLLRRFPGIQISR